MVDGDSKNFEKLVEMMEVDQVAAKVVQKADHGVVYWAVCTAVYWALKQVQMKVDWMVYVTAGQTVVFEDVPLVVSMDSLAVSQMAAVKVLQQVEIWVDEMVVYLAGEKVAAQVEWMDCALAATMDKHLERRSA